MSDDRALFVDEVVTEPQSRGRHPRRALVVIGTVVLVVAVGTAVGLAATSSPPSGQDAEHAVLSALDATTASGSFDFNYQLSSTPPTTTPSTTTTTSPCPIGAKEVAPISSGPAVSPPAPTFSCVATGTQPSATGPTVTGGGTIDTDPYAMVATATIGSGLQVTVRVDSADVYEDLGQLDSGLSPPASEEGATGQPLSGFAGITESTLGDHEGAMALLDMANPTGYLDLSQASVTSAAETGTSTADGVAVTEYRVSVDDSQLADSPGISTEESATIEKALALLDGDGYTGTTVDLAIDGSGFVRNATSVARFSDGSTATTSVTFSQFGCAGTVLMPGQTTPGSGTSGCADGSSGSTGATSGSATTTGTVPASVSPQGATTSPTPQTSLPVTGLPTTVPTTQPASTSTTTPSTTTTGG